MLLKKQERWQEKINLTLTKRHCSHVGDKNKGWFYKLTLLDFGLIFEIKM